MKTTATKTPTGEKFFPTITNGRRTYMLVTTAEKASATRGTAIDVAEAAMTKAYEAFNAVLAAEGFKRIHSPLDLANAVENAEAAEGGEPTVDSDSAPTVPGTDSVN
jgi:rubrerythrin